MKVRNLLLVGSTVALLAGIAVAGNSLQLIISSQAAVNGAKLLPELTQFETITAESPRDIRIGIKHGDFIGTLTIPRLKKSVPVFEGTDAEALKKGAGHYEKSVLPGVSDNSVIAGHRDSVFSNFGLLKRGDLLIVKTAYGKFTYVIKSFRIVDGDDRTVIVPTERATLTLSTCYPFHFVGSAPQRFIVSAYLKR